MQNFPRIFFFLLLMIAAPASQALAQGTDTEMTLPSFTKDEVLEAARDFFGPNYTALPAFLEKAFGDLGEPTAFVTGTEGPGEIEDGVRYGEGFLYEKDQRPSRIYWRGPAVGFELVPEGTKVMVLVYNLHSYRSFYKRYEAGEDDVFTFGGLGMSYKERQAITLAILKNWEGTQFGVTPGWIKFDDDPMIQPK